MAGLEEVLGRARRGAWETLVPVLGRSGEFCGSFFLFFFFCRRPGLEEVLDFSEEVLGGLEEVLARLEEVLGRAKGGAWPA